MEEIARPEGYPKTSFGSIVCWYCLSGHRQLFRLKDPDGFKTPDYVCVQCKVIAPPYPPMQNVSTMYFPKKKKKAIKKVSVAIEGDKIE